MTDDRIVKFHRHLSIFGLGTYILRNNCPPPPDFHVGPVFGHRLLSTGLSVCSQYHVPEILQSLRTIEQSIHTGAYWCCASTYLLTLFENKKKEVSVPELSTGHFSWTRPDPAKLWPDPTRDFRQKVWPDPTNPEIISKKLKFPKCWPDPPKSGKIVTRHDPRVHPTRGQLWSVPRRKSCIN